MISRRVVAVGLAAGLVAVGMVGTTAAHPGRHEHGQPEDPAGGVGVRVNTPETLAGFLRAVHWDGTPEVDDQTADLVYAGTGCSPASYAGVDVAGRIALVDHSEGRGPADLCPAFTFAQKMQSAEQAGAIGLVQVRYNDDVSPGSAAGSGIPGLELRHSDGAPIRDAVVGGTPVNVTLTSTQEPVELPPERLSNVACVDGKAAVFDCDGVDLLSFVPLEEFRGQVDIRQALRGGASDLWGWTDPDSGDEYVIIGKTNGVGFFRITDPTNPVYLGELPNRALLHQIWHDIKVYDNHAFIVSESQPHGMKVFDLTRLRDVDEPQVWTEDGFYPLPAAAHNVEINTATGYAYIVGGNAAIVVPDQCLSGLHMVDISSPETPVFAGCYLEEGGPGTLARTVGEPAEELSPAAYVHDTQCVVYDGPDTRYTGREICFNSAENKVVIADVTDKLNPVTLGMTDYPMIGYTHQGWLTEDQSYLLVNDEMDETKFEINTRTVVLDVRDLENPTFHFAHSHDTRSITHNNYIQGRLVYQSNYTSGLRVLDTAFVGDPADPRLEPIGFFDTFPAHGEPTFEGTWSNYPYFASGTIAVSGIDEGLFLLRLNDDARDRLKPAPAAGAAPPPGAPADAEPDPGEDDALGLGGPLDEAAGTVDDVLGGGGPLPEAPPPPAAGDGGRHTVTVPATSVGETQITGSDVEIGVRRSRR